MDDPDIRMINEKTGTAQARCGLLAGFAYYELSRQSGASVALVPKYSLLLLASFALAVSSTAVSVFIRIAMRRVKISEYTKFKKLWSMFANLSYSCYFVASFLWISSMCLMGQVYNNAADFKSASPEEFAYAEHLANLPMYFLTPTLMTCLVFLFWISRLSKKSKSAKRRESLANGTLLANTAEQTRRAASDNSDATMYLLGFTGAGLARYHQILAHEGTEMQKILNVSFWVLINLAAAALVLVNICGTNLSVLMGSLSPPKQHFLHKRIEWLTKYLSSFVNMGIGGVLFSGIFVGWGCSSSCTVVVPVFDEFSDAGTRTQEDGVCYATTAIVPAVISGIATLACLVMYVGVRRAKSRAKAKFQSQGQTHLDFDHVETFNKTLAVWSSQASLFSGFVFYNVVCFDSDVLHAPIPARFSLGVTGWNVLFLAVTDASFALGVAIVVVIGFVRSNMKDLQTQAEQELFKEELDQIYRLIGTSRSVALYCFMASFALLGVVKMSPARWEPAIVTVIAATMYVFWEMWAHRTFEDAMKSTQTLEDLGTWQDVFGIDWLITYPRINDQMSIASNAFFFGAFAYNGVNFLFRPEAVFAGAYTGMFAMCFMLALSLVLAENTLNMHMARLDTEAKKEKYGRWWTLQLRDAWKIYCRIYQSFLAGVALLGPVKLWEYNQTSVVECTFGPKGEPPGPCQQIYTDNLVVQQSYSRQYGCAITLAGLSFLFVCRYFVGYYSDMAVEIMMQMTEEHKERLKRGEKVKAEESREFRIEEIEENVEPMAEEQPSGKKTQPFLKRSLTSVDRVPFKEVMEDLSIPMTACTFQTGNVFYEVVFTVVNPDDVAANWMYLGFSLVTLAFGTLTIISTQVIIFWILDFQTDEGKERFAAKLAPTVDKMFRFYRVTLVSWLVAMMASSSVKYPEFWWYSLSTSCFALTMILGVWTAIVRKAANRYENMVEEEAAPSWKELFKKWRATKK